MLDVGPRLLACDVDGTLLDSEGHLHPGVWRAVDHLREHGVHVVLATGRSPWATEEVCQLLGLVGPQITMQGGLISSPLDGEILAARTLEPSDVASHVAFAREIGVQAVVCGADGYRAERRPATTGSNSLSEQLVREASRFRVVRSLADEASGGVIRTVLLTPESRNLEVREATRRRFGSRYSIVWSDAHAVELLAPGTHKGSALCRLARELGIDMRHVAAIGDGWNDREMLQMAGISAAMAGAPEAVRSAATMVVPSSDDDGALVAFRRFFPWFSTDAPSWAPAHRWVTRSPLDVRTGDADRGPRQSVIPDERDEHVFVGASGARSIGGPRSPAAPQRPMQAYAGRKRLRVVQPRRRPGLSRT